jgi:hypothetical protein
MWGVIVDCSLKGNNLLQCSLNCHFCSNRLNGRLGIAKSEKIAIRRWTAKKKPPEGGFRAK